MKSCLFGLYVFVIIWGLCQLSGAMICFAETQRTGHLQSVPAVSQRPEWNRFEILVWPYKTDVLRDFELYQKLGLGGFQIDRGAGKDKKVDFSVKHNFPYYVGHAADKGYLYLTGNNVRAVTDKRGLATRPRSLADPGIMEEMKEHLLKNVTTTQKGLVLAYAFDDEISLGHFVSPCDVDRHPLSLAWFRQWLEKEYESIERLNRQWGASYKGFDEVMPKGFEEVRNKAGKPPLSLWNLSPWMDFRHFMDFQFAAVLAELTRYTNSLDPDTPAGFVGGQGPGTWGGYDYALLSRSVQWMEAYDIHGANEILRSFWSHDSRPRMQTFFSTRNPRLDSWFLWYYMLHGNQAVIAWPEGWFHADGHDIAPHILANKRAFKEIQGEVSEYIVNPQTIFDPDPIGIYYSHPSIQAGWAMDAITHGKTWVKRKSSIDNKNQSKGALREVWCKTLEDLGYQYDFVNYLDVKEGKVDLNKKFKVIILPKTICLSMKEADALRQFVKKGGTLIADYLCGLMDEHGKGRVKGALDDLFGITRDESAGYMSGKGLTEIDGEKYEKPYLKRFTYYDGAYRYNNIIVFERGTRHNGRAKGIEIKEAAHRPSVIISRRFGKGRSIYCNLSPLEYLASSRRFGNYGIEWRKIVSKILHSAGLMPRVKVYEDGNPVNMIECLYWKNADRHYLGLVKNPTDDGKQKNPAGIFDLQGVTGKEVEIQLEFSDTVALKNLRTNEHLGVGRIFHDRFKPWEGNLYKVVNY